MILRCPFIPMQNGSARKSRGVEHKSSVSMGNLKEGVDQTYGGCKRTPNLLFLFFTDISVQLKFCHGRFLGDTNDVKMSQKLRFISKRDCQGTAMLTMDPCFVTTWRPESLASLWSVQWTRDRAIAIQNKWIIKETKTGESKMVQGAASAVLLAHTRTWRISLALCTHETWSCWGNWH